MNLILPLTLLLTPAYVIKLGLFGFPTDVLMVWVIFVWVIFGVWTLAKHQLLNFWRSVTALDKKVLIPVGLFFLSGIISLFAHGFDRAKLGQFIVLFLQPISIFFIAHFLIQQFPRSSHHLLLTTYFLLAAAGVYAIIQYFTLWGLPGEWWGNSVEPKRALSFFVHPNFYGLWAAPLLALLLPDLAEAIKTKASYLKPIAWVLAGSGLILSLSRAAWLGLAAAVIVYALVAADKKIRRIIFSGALLILIATASVPNLRWRLLLPFYGEKSAVSRFSLWQTGIKGIKQSPVLGLGLTGFARQWPNLNTDPGLAGSSHNFPHNIFLDLWVETGLLGLLSFIGLASVFIWRGIKHRENVWKLSAALFVIAVIFSGLVDNPYFKNDLALIFWLSLSLAG